MTANTAIPLSCPTSSGKFSGKQESYRSLKPCREHWPAAERRPPTLSPIKGDLAATRSGGAWEPSLSGVGRGGGGSPMMGVWGNEELFALKWGMITASQRIWHLKAWKNGNKWRADTCSRGQQAAQGTAQAALGRPSHLRTSKFLQSKCKMLAGLTEMSTTQYAQLLNHHIVQLKLINVKGQISSKIKAKLLRKKQNCYLFKHWVPSPSWEASSIKHILHLKYE